MPGPPQPGYPPPSPYGYPGYPPYGYPTPYPYAPPPGYPYQPPRPGRPGTTIAAAVLGFVLAAVLLVAAMLLLGGASAINSVADDIDADTSWTVEWLIDAVINLFAAGALIAGGVALLSRQRVGLYLMSAANLVVIACGVYWVARFDVNGGLAGFAIVFCGLAVVSTALAWTPNGLRWLSAARPSQQP